MDGKQTYRIGIVGPCGSGKSTLIALLKQMGIEARHIAQEHSYVPDMWQRLTNPDILVFLEVSYHEATRRRRLNWTQDEYQEQLHRLRHAHQHATFCINTNGLTPEQVLQHYLQSIKLIPPDKLNRSV